MPRFMTIWLPRWPVQRRFVEQPQWRAAPLFVCRQRHTGVMTVVSWWLPPLPDAPRGAARDQSGGIVAGMALAEAMEVLARSRGVQACRSAVIDPDDPVADREALAGLARWCRRFAPVAAVEYGADGGREPARSQGFQPECIHVDVGGTAGFFGGEERLARLAVWTLSGRGFHARTAIADTPAAAWAAAHHTNRLAEIGCRGAAVSGSRRGGGGTAEGTPTAAHHGDRRPADSAVARPVDQEGNGDGGPGSPGARGVSSSRGSWPARPDSSSRRFAVVPAGEAAALLAPLPASALRLDESDLERLAELGIDTLGGVLRLPRKELAARFGTTLPRRLAEFSGARAEPLAPPEADALPQARHAWEAPVLLRDMPRDILERIVERLVADCVAPLAAAGHGITALQVRLERPRWNGGADAAMAEGPTVIDVGLYRPSAAVAHLTDLVSLRMARAPLPREIDAVAVEVLAAGRTTARQRLLFDGAAEASQAQVGMLLDRLSGRLGRRAVFAPRIVADAQPEHGWMAAPPLVPARGGGASDRGPRAARTAGERPHGMATGSRRAARREHRSAPGVDWKPAAQRRPTWLVPRPRRLEVVSVVPDGPPVRLRRQGRWERVLHAQGAERIETAWWRGACVRRDYWIVEVESGERLWIFRRLPDGAWFLHGLFA
ncbi:MAG: hypothetical protein FJ309_15215 [Planctomycetes bacterium]|nr:hypothetical protein [Planctomycetota bacterium]